MRIGGRESLKMPHYVRIFWGGRGNLISLMSLLEKIRKGMYCSLGQDQFFRFYYNARGTFFRMVRRLLFTLYFWALELLRQLKKPWRILTVIMNRSCQTILSENFLLHIPERILFSRILFFMRICFWRWKF